MSHLKRLLTPTFWKASKKEKKWIVSPSPGPHPKLQSIPLAVILKHIINIAATTTEAKKIIRQGDVVVDGKRRKDYAYPVGLFDILSIPKLKKTYRVVPSKAGLELLEISENEGKTKICKIKSKTILKKGKVQLNLHDGKNILVGNGNYKTGDSLLVELPSLKIVEHLPMEKGSIGMISRGTGAGVLSTIKDMKSGAIREVPRVVCEINKEDRIIGKNNFIVVGKEKPVIKLS
ncbi:MAG: 30S ribosomal protein S4e [Candidatus Aenigmarchaeota archaeon]|nr:30S ribosomal protein S4e [Candidatus Aenigmarchaeota archaeon]